MMACVACPQVVLGFNFVSPMPFSFKKLYCVVINTKAFSATDGHGFCI
jgi:hypothetical protein